MRAGLGIAVLLAGGLWILGASCTNFPDEVQEWCQRNPTLCNPGEPDGGGGDNPDGGDGGNPDGGAGDAGFPEGCKGRSGEWTLTGYTTSTRDSHTATLLGNGKVLVAGGTLGSDNAVGTTELYDPEYCNWAPAEPMKRPRLGHAAVLLSTGKVLVMGGQSHTTTPVFENTAELYDPESDSWTLLTPRMSDPRSVHTATVTSCSGKECVLVAGGENANTELASVEVYDPETHEWSLVAAMNQRRAAHTATSLGEGKVLVAGGYNNTGDGTLDTAEVYDPLMDRWTPTATPMPSHRSSHTATLMPEQRKVLITGGNFSSGPLRQAALYDLAQNRWTAAADLPSARRYHAAALLPSGEVLVLGGYTTTVANEHLNTAVRFIPDGGPGGWAPALNMKQRRAYHTATPLPSGAVLTVGGSRAVNTAEVYVP